MKHNLCDLQIILVSWNGFNPGRYKLNWRTCVCALQQPNSSTVVAYLPVTIWSLLCVIMILPSNSFCLFHKPLVECSMSDDPMLRLSHHTGCDVKRTRLVQRHSAGTSNITILNLVRVTSLSVLLVLQWISSTVIMIVVLHSSETITKKNTWQTGLF